MTDINWQDRKRDAAEVLRDINSDKLTREDYMLMGASIAILDHNECVGTETPMIQEDPTRTHMHSDGILDDFSIILSRYANSRSAADRDAMRITLKSQLNAIEKELVEMRAEIHDPECVQMFIEFRENIKLRI